MKRIIVAGWFVSFLLAVSTPFARAYFGHSGAVRVPLVISLILMVVLMALLRKRQRSTFAGVTTVASGTTAGVGMGMSAMGLLAGRQGPIQFGTPWLIVSLVLTVLLIREVRTESGPALIGTDPNATPE